MKRIHCLQSCQRIWPIWRAWLRRQWLRAAIITGMRWEQVDLERRMAWVRPDQTKARRAVPVPLNSEAIAVLQNQIGKHRVGVFTLRGQPMVATITRAWYSAFKRAGVAPLRFHDLRHRLLHGMCSKERRCQCCKNWAVGRPARWCRGTLTRKPNIWHLGMTVWRATGQRNVAQIWHSRPN